MENIIIFTAVSVAVFFIGRRFYKQLKGGEGCSCGCACSGGKDDTSCDLPTGADTD